MARWCTPGELERFWQTKWTKFRMLKKWSKWLHLWWSHWSSFELSAVDSPYRDAEGVACQ